MKMWVMGAPGVDVDQDAKRVQGLVGQVDIPGSVIRIRNICIGEMEVVEEDVKNKNGIVFLHVV